MERLHFVCPRTGREIDAGIETELDTLLRIKKETIRLVCAACGEEHEWPVSDARLTSS